MSTQIPDPYQPSHGDLRYAVRHYDLTLNYKVATNHLAAEAVLHITTLADTSELAVDLVDLQVKKVRLDGAAVKHTHARGRLTVRLPKQAPAGTDLHLTVHYAGKPRPCPGPHGRAGWEELTDGVLVASQPYGAPSWYPCNDRAADKATYRITVTAASNYHVVACGTLDSRRTSGGSTTWVYEQGKPTSPYLVTLAIGRLTALQQSPTVQVLHPPQVPVAGHTSLARQPEMMAAFETLFGLYPFDGYRAVVADDVLEIPLEAQGLSHFGRNFVSPTWDHERLVAHEMAHQWFGNSVTAGQWRDIWLHEGFACYAEWLWSEVSERASADEHARTQHRRLSHLKQDLILGDPGVRDMFDDRVYKRGALTLHALRTTVGDEPFFEMLRAWTNEHAYGVVDTPTFIAHAGRFTEVDLAPLFDAWLTRPALPALPVAGQRQQS